MEKPLCCQAHALGRKELTTIQSFGARAGEVVFQGSEKQISKGWLTAWLSGQRQGERNAFAIIAQPGKMHSLPAAAEPLSAGAGVRRIQGYFCALPIYGAPTPVIFTCRESHLQESGSRQIH
jgi:hypothetical protein